jgi:RNA polymerase sigma-70 factor, ECF subfamily
VVVTSSGTAGRRLFDAAHDGDEDAFRQLIEPHQAELRAHCYRMLGSVQDAEDALQEALVGAWRGLPRFEGRSSLRSWLYRIATNACLKAIERRPKRVLPVDFGPAADPHEDPAEPIVESVWVEPFPDELLGDSPAGPDAVYEKRESVELAFIAALQHLPARQRAVLLLRDVLGFSGGEVAASLDTTPEAVYSALQRAHNAIEERLPERTQQATLSSLGDRRLRRLVDRYVDAWERGDVDELAAMLTDDAAMAMPPRPTWYRGRDAVAAFLRAVPLAGDLRSRLVCVSANGQRAFGHYTRSGDAGAYIAHGVNVITLRGSQIEAIDAFLTPEVFPIFGLPDQIAA